MKIERLLEILTARGVRLVLRDGKPSCRGDTKALTPTLRKALATYRDKLIPHCQAVEVPAPPKDPEPESPPIATDRCSRCWLCCQCPQHQGSGLLFLPCRKCERLLDETPCTKPS